jgi:rhodanese-related sulfurtransferase
MKRIISALLKISVALTLVAASSLNAVSGSAPRITKEELKSMLGDEKLVIVDVRVGKDWNSSKYKIKGAVQADPMKVESWASSYGKDKTFVVY